MYCHYRNGLECEYLAAAWFTRNGYSVSWPLDGSIEFDFIINDCDGTKRVQVKKIFFDNRKQRFTASLAKTHLKVGGKTKYEKYNENSFDLCAFICIEYNTIYIVPIEFVYKRRSITFYPDGTKPSKRPFDFEQFKRTLINLHDE